MKIGKLIDRPKKFRIYSSPSLSIDIYSKSGRFTQFSIVVTGSIKDFPVTKAGPLVAWKTLEKYLLQHINAFSKPLKRPKNP